MFFCLVCDTCEHLSNYDTCLVLFMYICIYVYMYICIYVYMYICIYVYMYICIYVYMFICIYVYMYVCVYVYILDMYLCFYFPCSGSQLGTSTHPHLMFCNLSPIEAHLVSPQ